MQATATRRTERGSARQALSPLLFDVAVPVGVYYLLTAVGVGDKLALVAGGIVPFARSVGSALRGGKADYLAIMMAALFVLSLILVAFTGSPKFMLVKESFGTALLGFWSLGSAWTARPMTFYTARPILTKGQPAALRCWDHLAETSTQFRAIQRRLATFWGLGLLADAVVRIAIVERYPVHTAAGLVPAAAVAIIVALCLLSGPLGGLRLQRLLAAELAARQPEGSLS